MKNQNDKLTLALFAQFKKEPDLNRTGSDFTIDVSLCCVPDNGETYPRGMHGDSPLENLHFIIRGGSWVLKCSEGKTPWHDGATICFSDVHFAKLDEVQAMAKALAGIHRKLDKMAERLGYAQNAFEYLARFADAVNAERIFFRNEPDTVSQTGEKFCSRSRMDGLARIRSEADKMQKSLQPQNEQSAAA